MGTMKIQTHFGVDVLYIMAMQLFLSRLRLTIAAAALLLFAREARGYNTVGIIDRAGNTIAPCEYHRIESLGCGRYFLEYMDEENPLKRSYRGRILEDSGREIPVRIPAGCTLSKVFLPKSTGASGKMHGLPTGTILEIHGPDGFGLCRLSGKTILEPKFDAVGEPNEEFFPVFSGNRHTDLLFTLDSVTGERVLAPAKATIGDIKNDATFPFAVNPGARGDWGYMARNGKVLLEPQFQSAGKFSENGLACVSTGRDTNFYIDKTGKVLSPSYEHAGDFFKETAVVEVLTDGQRRKGLINSKFEYVLKPEYLELQHLFDQVYVAKKEANDRYKAIRSDGEVMFAFPSETMSVGGRLDNLTGCVIKTGAGVFKYVLVDEKGKIVTPVGDKPLHLDYGLAVVRRKEANKHTDWELVDGDGRVVQPFQQAFLEVVGPNRILKYLPHDHFNAAAWKNPRPMGEAAGLNRIDHFAYFLADYDLIDMPRAKVEALLGPSEGESAGNFYWLWTGMCGNSWTGLEIEFENEKASRWRVVWSSPIADHPHSAPWVTDNMIYDPEPGDIGKKDTDPFMLLLPKRAQSVAVPPTSG